MTEMLLQAAALLAAAVIFARAEPVLNIMGPACWLPVRLAYWLLAVGPVALVLSITQGYAPDFGTVCALAGIACLMSAERRVRSLLRWQDEGRKSP